MFVIRIILTIFKLIVWLHLLWNFFNDKWEGQIKEKNYEGGAERLDNILHGCMLKSAEIKERICSYYIDCLVR